MTYRESAANHEVLVAAELLVWAALRPSGRLKGQQHLIGIKERYAVLDIHNLVVEDLEEFFAECYLRILMDACDDIAAREGSIDSRGFLGLPERHRIGRSLGVESINRTEIETPAILPATRSALML